MIGKLDVEEDIMDDSLIAKRKAAAVMKTVHEQLANTIAELGWDCYDNVAVEIGGTSVYEIEGAGTKWAPVKGTRKYNKDAFYCYQESGSQSHCSITTQSRTEAGTSLRRKEMRGLLFCFQSRR